MTTCYIVDDEKHSIEVLSEYVENTPNLELIGFETDPIVALSNISENKIAPEITFLDIDMPKLSGINLSMIIKNKTNIIFVTAFKDYAIDAFDINAVDYILKPISYERFLKGVNRVNERRANQNPTPVPAQNPNPKYIFVQVTDNNKTSKVKINTEEIIRIQGLGNYIHLFTNSDKNYVFYGRLMDLQEQLPADFIRCHKSHIISLKYVEVIEGSKVFLKNKFEVPIGAKFKNEFMNKF